MSIFLVMDNGEMKCERVNTFNQMAIVMTDYAVVTNTSGPGC